MTKQKKMHTNNLEITDFITSHGVQPIRQANLVRIKGSSTGIEANEERTRGTGG